MAELNDLLDRLDATAAGATQGLLHWKCVPLPGAPSTAEDPNPQAWLLEGDQYVVLRHQAPWAPDPSDREHLATAHNTHAAYRRFARDVAVGSRASPSNVIDNIDRAIDTLTRELDAAMGGEDKR